MASYQHHNSNATNQFACKIMWLLNIFSIWKHKMDLFDGGKKPKAVMTIDKWPIAIEIGEQFPFPLVFIAINNENVRRQHSIIIAKYSHTQHNWFIIRASDFVFFILRIFIKKKSAQQNSYWLSLRVWFEMIDPLTKGLHYFRFP